MTDSGRFIIRRRLGEGGMGVVHEAFDRERQEVVALKTLPAVDGAAVYRLKQEFRTLTDVAHPNLVSLYELVGEEGKWFFTMELVDGVTFLEYVRPRGPGETDGARRSGGRSEERSAGLHEERVRDALRQLTEGLRALHRAGKVHRDLKPSNVLVARDGRLVILDFGLTVDQGPEARKTATRGWASGSIHYMSPEQIERTSVSTASDWYAVGVMLYEALSGSLPFEGSIANMIYRKLSETPRPVLERARGAPRDLAGLCDALLSRAPSSRPGGREILRVLGVDTDETSHDDPMLEPHAFVARETHLRALQQALLDTRDGNPVTLYLHGLSGMGKSRVVDEFLSRVEAGCTPVLLRGRCYDRESVPYNAFDGVIDSLSHYMRTLPRSKLRALLPEDFQVVTRLFPVLLRVEAVEELVDRLHERPEPVELRRRAVRALRELLARIAEQAPLVLHVDDWHWSDADSVSLVDELLRGPDAPKLLLILGFRSEEVPSKTFLQTALEKATTLSHRELRVGPLTDSESARLVDVLLGPDLRFSDELRDGIVREAAGSPFLIEQLCRHVMESKGVDTGPPELADMLEARIERLPRGSRALLETLAVAGRPVDFEVAHRAAGIARPPSEVRALVTTLRVAQMVRPSGRTDTIELYHDRIREEIADRVGPADVIRIHGRLAEALANASEADPGTLFEHYRGAGESERAGKQAARAGGYAAEALAFDRAVVLYRQAIELGSPDVKEVVAWQERLGDALAASGRPGDAARAYLAAADEAPRFEALNLRRSAAEHFLIGGHIDRGLEVTRSLMSEVGLSMPESPRRMVVGLLLRRFQIWLRGFGYETPDPGEDQTLKLLRLDICLSCALGLALTDYITAAYFQARYLLLALDAGEPRRLARAFAFEGGFVAARGGRAEDRTARLVTRARKLAEEVGTPRELGMVAVTAGSAASMQGRFVKAVDLCDEAEKILREQCTGVHWELTTCQLFLTTSLIYLGRTRRLAKMVPTLIESAEKRGSLFEGVEHRTHPNICWLVQDDPEEARRQLSVAMSIWDLERFYRQQWLWLLAETEIDLYIRAPSVAWARIEQHLPALRRSQLLRVQFLSIEASNMRGRAAVASAAAGHSPGDRIRIAEKCARRIEREQMSWSNAFAPLLRAGIASVRGEQDQTRDLLARALAGFEAADVGLYANAAKRRLGQVLGGDEGRRLIHDADAAMRSEAIESPERLAAMLAPGVYP